MQTALTDCTDIDKEIDAAIQEAEVVATLIQRSVEENSRTALDQDDYRDRYDRLVKRYETAKETADTLQKKRTARLHKADAIGGFMFRLQELDQPLETFTDGLWIDTVDQVIVRRDGTLLFRFRNGSEVTV